MDLLEPRGFHFYEGGAKWIARGVTYGPFRPGVSGQPYPPISQMRSDFAAMAQAGINVLRLYEVPEEDLASLAADHGIRLLLDVPWPKHLDVYGDREKEKLCIGLLEERMARMAGWGNVMGLLLGNEIPADLVRWAGTGKVLAFLRRLYERAKEMAPRLPMGYANYPSTEFLQPRFLDFLGFNIYLEDKEAFRKYLIRLKLQYPEKPLLLTEMGLDTYRHGESLQCQILTDGLTSAYEAGMAGAFIFSWTDEWHTGGFDINRWAFGLVDQERRPKPALEAVRQCFIRAPRCRLFAPRPTVSVVVATHNGARTLRQCLSSLKAQNYEGREIVVVDDGSTDETQQILEDFPEAKILTQDNQGLSAARNAGIAAASGEIVAFTDSDCVADPDWLHHLVMAMIEGGFAGMGGPNLAPAENQFIPEAIALAPGHATHVLIDESEAEHVPGCNMAFRKEALLEIGGFNPIYRKAGDDVDVIWRLRDKGYRVGFSPAALVWHHRRPTLRAYIRQQIGYGEAEAMLLREHPHRFNDRGQSIWAGFIYAGPESSALLRPPNIHYGVFGSAGFQCLYERPGGYWGYLISSPEWGIACLALLACGPFSIIAVAAGLAGLSASILAAGLRARRRWAAGPTGSSAHFIMAWFLWVAQPLCRGLARYWFRYKFQKPPPDIHKVPFRPVTPALRQYFRSPILQYWSDQAPERVEILRLISRKLTDMRWHYSANSEWEPWDISILVSWWFKLRLTSAEENHGQQKRLLRLRLALLPTSLFYLATAAAIATSIAVVIFHGYLGRLIAMAFLGSVWLAYRHACRGRSVFAGMADDILRDMGFVALNEQSQPVSEQCSLPYQPIQENQPVSKPACGR